MHASSNFVVILQGKKNDRKRAKEYLQQFSEEEFEDDKKLIFEETYELVWFHDIVDEFAKIAKEAPDMNFAVSGYVDCSENSGEFMDFGIIYKGGVMVSYSSDWEGYDDVEFDEDGDAEECYGRYDRFLEMEELDVSDIDAALEQMCQEIQEKEWIDIGEVELDE